MEMNWTATPEMPKKPGQYLVTLWGGNIIGNYVAYTEYICRPWHGCDKFLNVNGNDITEDVLAWIEFPDPYKVAN